MRPKETPKPRPRATVSKADKAAAAKRMAASTINILNGVGTRIVGPEGAMLPEEQQWISDPLCQLIEDSEVLGAASGKAAPLFLAVGLGLWAMRTSAIYRYKVAALRAQQEAAIRAQHTYSPNGTPPAAPEPAPIQWSTSPVQTPAPAPDAPPPLNLGTEIS